MALPLKQDVQNSKHASGNPLRSSGSEARKAATNKFEARDKYKIQNSNDQNNTGLDMGCVSYKNPDFNGEDRAVGLCRGKKTSVDRMVLDFEFLS